MSPSSCRAVERGGTSPATICQVICKKIHFLLLLTKINLLGETGAPPKQPGSKPLQRCPTVHNPTSGNSKQNQEQKTNGNNGTNAGAANPGAPGASSTKRKESVTWSPFGALGKAVSSGVNIVGDATKAVGTGVVQGTKVCGKVNFKTVM